MAVAARCGVSSFSAIAKLALPPHLNVVNLEEFTDEVFINLVAAGMFQAEFEGRISKNSFPVISPEQFDQLISNCLPDQQILATLLEHYPDAFHCSHLYAIVGTALSTGTSLAGISKFVSRLPVAVLLQDDFLAYFYLLSCGPKPKLPGIQDFPFQDILLKKDAIHMIQANQSLPMLALSLALVDDYCLEPAPDLDFSLVILTAIAYVKAANNKSMVQKLSRINSIDISAYPKDEIHILFENKLKHTFVDKTKTDAAVVLQGAVRTRNRMEAIYPALFAPSQNDYLFWMEGKPRSRIEALSDVFGSFAQSYLDSHGENRLSRHLFSLIPFTYQRIWHTSHLINIVETGYLLSKEAREQAGMGNFKSENTGKDTEAGEGLLTCTAPHEVDSRLPFCQVSIAIKLSELPASSLQHCIVKLADFAVREIRGDVGTRSNLIACEITPTISLTLLKVDEFKESNYNFHNSVYQLTNQSTGLNCELNVRGENEIFHGLAGFREALLHILCVIDSLADTGTEGAFKKEIQGYFEELRTKNSLTGHLDNMFKGLFKYMEIDFQRGLPLSLAYIESIEVGAKNINLSGLRKAAKEGDLNKIMRALDEHPDFLRQPFFIRGVLEEITPVDFYKACSLFEERFPAAYLEALHCMGINDESLPLLKQRMNALAHEPLLTPRYDLKKMLNGLKAHLKGNSEERHRLTQKYEVAVSELAQQIRFIYSDFSFAGGNSKIIEVFTNPRLMALITGKNKDIIAAILAFEAEAELTQSTSKVTLIAGVKSQRTKDTISVTLGSLLEHMSKIPPSLIEITPVNRRPTLSEHETIRVHLRQRYYFRHTYKKLVGLVEAYSLKLAQRDLFQKPAEVGNQIKRFKNIVAAIPDSYVKNSNITDEAKIGLKNLLHYLEVDTALSKDELVERFLTSTAILNFQIAHLLFDTTHFAVALQGSANFKIRLNGGEISFAEFIQACMEKMDFAKNPAYAMTSQQLTARVQWLQLQLEAS